MTDPQTRRGRAAASGAQVDADGVSELVVEDQLCFALYSASRAITSCYRAALAATGLTYSQYLVMMVVWEADRSDGELTLKTIGERLKLDNGTLSPLVKRLAAMGLVTRQRSGADERLLEVACTPAGRALYPPAVAAQAAVSDATGMAPHEIAFLRETLLRMDDRLRTAVLDGPPPEPDADVRQAG